MRLLLGFGNKARHGKDTAATAVVNHYGAMGVPTKHVSFAGALRQEVTEAIQQADGIDNLLAQPLSDGTLIPFWVTPDLDPIFDEAYPLGKHPKLLQWWGTEYRRSQDPDYWVKKLFSTLRDFNGVVVISDCRFINEFDAIKSNGGFTVQVNRLNVDGSPFVASDRDPSHISETTLDNANWDFFIKVKDGDIYLTKQHAISIAQFVEISQEIA